MSGLTHLEKLAEGSRPADAGLLGTAKLSWSRVDRMSEEDIISSFAAHPFAIDEGSLLVETAQGAAIIGSDAALLADLYNGRIGRLWRVGDEIEYPEEPVLSVAFDTDMEQGRHTSIRYRWEDHPELPKKWHKRLIGECEAMIDARRRSNALRARGFIVRAFGRERTAAALLSVFVLSGDGERSASSSYCVIGIDESGESRIVNARGQTGRWTPRL